MAAAIEEGRQDAVDELVTFIIDFSDAFSQIPLHPSERRYAVVYFRGRYIVFLRTPQGSRGAPLLWARVAALICRRVTLSITISYVLLRR